MSKLQYLFISSIIVVICLTAFSAIHQPAIITDPIPAEVVTQAWEQAKASGRYSYHSQVEQTSYPLPSLANSGRQPETTTLVLDGDIDVPADTMTLTLLQGDLPIDIESTSGTTRARVVTGAWEEIDSVTDMFAPGRDPLGFLNAAADIKPGETRQFDFGSGPIVYTQYTFMLDGNAYATYMRTQLEAQLFKYGRPPAGLRLNTADLYNGMTGTGEIWIDGDGLPARLMIDMEIPANRDNGRSVSNIVSDYTDFERSNLVAVDPWGFQRPQGSGVWTFAVQGGFLFAFAIFIVAQTFAVGVDGVGKQRFSSEPRWFRPRRPLPEVRHFYRPLSFLLIFSFVVTPFIQARQTYAFSENLAADRAASDARHAGAEEQQSLQAELNQNNWKPNRSAFINFASSPQSKGAMAVSAKQFPIEGIQANPPALVGNSSNDGDNDGLSDADEAAWGTDPADPDSDGDTLTDGQEVNQLGTTPTQADSDGDGIADNLEVSGFSYNGQTWYSDPFHEDSNRDGLLDGQECLVWFDGSPDFDANAICPDADGNGTPDLFDDDNDGDGVPDAQDLSPNQAVGTVYGQNNPLKVGLTNYTVDRPILFDLQFVPTDRDHLNYHSHILDWPSGDTAGQIQRRLDTTFASTTNTEIKSTAANAGFGDVRLVPMLEVTMPYTSGSYASLPITSTAPAERLLGQPVSNWINGDELDPFAITVSDSNSDTGELTAYVPLNQVRDDNGQTVSYAARMVYQPSQAAWGADHEYRVVWLVQTISDECIDLTADPDTCARQDVLNVAHVYPESWKITGLDVSVQHGLESAILYENPADDADLDIDDQLWTASWNLQNSFLRGRDFDTNGDLDVTVSNLSGQVATWFAADNYTTVETFSYPHQAYMAKMVADETTRILQDTFTPYATQTVPNLLYVHDYQSQALGLDLLGENFGTDLVIDFDSVPTNRFATVSMTPYQYSGSEWQVYDAETYLTLLQYRFETHAEFDPANYGSEAETDGRIKWALMYYTALLQGSTALIASDGTTVWTPSDSAPEFSYNPILPPNTAFGPTLVIASYASFFAYASVSQDSSTFFKVISKIAGASSNSIFVFDDLSVQVTRQLKGQTLSLSMNVASSSALFIAAAIGGTLLLSGLITGDQSAVRIGIIFLNAVTLVITSVYIFNAFQAIRQAASVAVGTTLQKFNSVLKVASRFQAVGALGFVLGAGLTWGLYASSIDGSIAGQYALATAIATTVVLIILLVLDILGFGVIGLLLVIIDAILALFGVTGATSAIIEALADLLYDIDYVITNLDDPNRLKVNLDGVDFVNPNAGFSVGNSIVVSYDITNTVNIGAELSGSLYGPYPGGNQTYSSGYDFNTATERSKFIYSVGPTGSDAVPTQQTVLPNPWVYTTSEIEQSLITGVYRQMQVTDTVTTTINLADVGVGINQPLPIIITESYLASYEGCWLGFIDCTWESFTGTSPIDVGQYQLYDILPNTLSGFVAMDWGGSAIQLPPQADPDGDSLTSNNGVDPAPNAIDGDGDGLTDYYEITNGLDPESADPDGDGLNDGEELLYKTNPFVADSDGDGLNDRIETKVGWLIVHGNNQVTRVWSNPFVADFDGDGLDDLEELSFGFNPWVATDPSIIDTLVEFDDISVSEFRAPKLLLQFEEPADSQTFSDRSGNGQIASCDLPSNNCPVSGMAGQFGSAVHFDSANDQIELDGLSLSDSFSFALWVKQPGNNVIADYFTVQDNDDGDLIRLAGGAHVLAFQLGTGAGTIVGSGGFSGNSDWHHLAIVYDGPTDTAFFYRDGTLLSSGDFIASNTFEGTGTLRLSDFPDIMFDDFGVYDVALTADEINKIMNGGHNINDMLVAPDDRLTYSATITNSSSTTATGYLLADSNLVSPTLPTMITAFNFETADRQVAIGNTLFGHPFTCLEDGTCPTHKDDTTDLANFPYLTHAFEFDGVDEKLGMPFLGLADNDTFTMTVDLDALPDKLPNDELMYLLDTQSDELDSADIYIDGDGVVFVELAGRGVPFSTHSLPAARLDPDQTADGGYTTITVGRWKGNGVYVADSLYIKVGDELYVRNGFIPGKLKFGPGLVGNHYADSQITRDKTPFQGSIATVQNGVSGIIFTDEVGTIQFQDQISDGFSARCDLDVGQCPAQTAGQQGEGLLFDGADDVLTLNPISLANQSFTLGVWAKRNSTGSIDTFVSQGAASSNAGLQFGFLANDQVRCGFENNGLETTTTTTDTDWHHWACSYDASTNLQQIFKDGVLVVSRTAPADYVGEGNLKIGQRLDEAGTQFDGALDELVILKGASFAGVINYLMETQASAIDISNLFTPISAVGLNTATVNDTFEIGSTVVSSQHRFEQTVDVALELQAQPTYLVAGENAADLIVYLPFEEAPGSSFFDNLVASDGVGWTCNGVGDCETVEAQCFGADCPSAGLRGPVGRSVYFDGIDDGLVLAMPANDTSLANRKTFAAWVKADRGTIFEALKAGSPNETYRLTVDQLFAPADGFNGGVIDLSDSISTDFPKNEWFHVALTLDTNTAKFYINGQLSKTETFTYFAADDKLGIGSRTDGSDSLHGFLDDVRFYDTLLSAAEISTLYNESAPYMVFDFDESGSQTAFTDRTVNALTGQPKVNSYFDSTLNETVIQLNPPIGADGKIGNVALFDGNGVIDVTDSAGIGSFTDDFSLMMWVKTTGTDIGLFNKSDGDDSWEIGEKQFYLDELGQPEFVGYGNNYIRSNTAINDGAWHHVAVVWDNASGKIYVDGVDVTGSSNYLANNADNPSDRSFIGAPNQSEVSDIFVGSLDELAWHGRVIHEAEIDGIYRNELRWYRDTNTTLVTIDADRPEIELLSDQTYWPNGYIQLAAATRDTTSYVTLFEIGVKGPGQSNFTWSTASICSEAADINAAWCPAFDSTAFGNGGKYTIQFRATDAVGNVGTSGTHQLFVDADRPQIFLDQSGRQPLTPVGSDGDQWTVALSGIIDDLNPNMVDPSSGVPADSLLISLKDGRGQVAGTGSAQLAEHSGGSWSIDYLFNGFRPVGPYTVHATLADNVGNVADLQIGDISLDGRAPKVRANSWVRAQGNLTETVTINGIAIEQPDWGREAAAYHFEQPITLGNGTVVYEDSGRQANYGTCASNCPTSVNGLFGQALEIATGEQINPDVFEVTASDGITVADHDSLDLTGDFSVGMWLKRSSDRRPGAAPLVVKGSHINTPEVNYYLHETYRGQIEFSYYAGSAIGWVEINDSSSVEILDTDVWSHIAVVVDVQNNQVRFYQDGILYSTQGNDFTAAPLISNDKPLLIGTTDGASTSAFIGILDELLIYDRALSADQIYALAQSDAYGVQSVETQFIDVNGNETRSTENWEPAILVNGVWTYTTPSNIEMMGELRVRAADAGSNTAEDGVVWRGVIDDVAPRLSGTGQWVNSNGIAETEYTFTVTDFVLNLDRLTHMCEAADVDLVNYSLPGKPIDGQPYVATATCRVGGHEAQNSVEACDGVGLCASITITPTNELTQSIEITSVVEAERFALGDTVTLAGDAESDKVIDRVELSVNGTVIETIVGNGTRVLPWSAEWMPNKAGPYTVIATMWDADGVPSADTVTIYIDPAQVTLTVSVSGSGTVVGANGQIDCGVACVATVDQGSVVTLTAVPDAGMVFVGWAGDVTSTNNPLIVTMSADQSVMAVFELEDLAGLNLTFLPLIMR